MLVKEKIEKVVLTLDICIQWPKYLHGSTSQAHLFIPQEHITPICEFKATLLFLEITDHMVFWFSVCNTG